MTTGRSAAIARGLGSLVLLGALLLGVPVALWTLVGSPLPTDIPDLATLEQAVRSGVNDDVIVKALALLAWLAWIQIALAILTEVAAVLRRRPSVRLPVFPGIQASAGRLVASIVMMVATFSPAAAMAAPARPAPVVAFAVPTSLDLPPSTWAAPPPVAPPVAPSAPSTAPTASRPSVTVERHDSYWAIAERTLGDGYRWREIRDLNVGRTMNTGHVVQPGSDLVLAGWVLDLPNDAKTGEATQTGSPVATPEAPNEVTVVPGDNFWTLAEEQLASASGHQPTDAETAPYWQSMVDANKDRLVVPGNASLIEPGQRLSVPPLPGVVPAAGPTVVAPPVITGPPSDVAPPPAPASAPPTEQPAAPTPTTLAVPAPPAGEAPPASVQVAPTATNASAEQIEAADESTPAPLPAIAVGLASAALAVGTTRVVRRRRRQAGHRSPASMARPTDDDARDLHQAFVAAGDDAAVEYLRRSVGDLAQAAAAAGGTWRPRIVHHGADHLDLFLDHACEDAPVGWSAEADGAVWTICDGGGEESADGDSVCAAPLLVTLGQPDDGGQLYLDLEAEGVVALTGDQEACRGVARAVLTELALTPLADTLEVLVIGDLAPPEARELDHVTLADCWDDVADDIAAWAEESSGVLEANGWANAFVARGHDQFHDGLAPVAVVANEPPPRALLDHVLAHRPASLALLTIGMVEGATTIDCTPDTLTVVDLGLVCTPYPLEPEVLDTIIDLVESAGDTYVEEPDGQLALIPSLLTACSSEPDRALAEPEFDIIVRVLGEIRVEGGEPLAAKQTAVVTYIALHGTVTADRLEDAVWASPTTTSRRKRLANTISECRALLGRRHLPPSSDGRYCTGPGIVTDVDLFDRRVKRAAEQPPLESVETLLSALELVTGPLFTYRNTDRASFAWVDVENWVSTWELKVAAVAERCADLLLDVGRCDEAVDVARHALSILPTHTALTEALMRAHAANGDRLAVQRVYQEHVGALQVLDLDDAEQSTTDLCDRLLDTRTG